MHARKELESWNNYHVALHPRDCAASCYMAGVRKQAALGDRYCANNRSKDN